MSVLTDCESLSTGTYTATSYANAIAADGPIQDLNGNGLLCLRDAQSIKYRLTQMAGAVDGADPLLTNITNLQTAIG